MASRIGLGQATGSFLYSNYLIHIFNESLRAFVGEKKLKRQFCCKFLGYCFGLLRLFIRILLEKIINYSCHFCEMKEKISVIEMRNS